MENNDRRILIEMLTRAGIYVEYWPESAGIAFGINDSAGERIIFLFSAFGELISVEVG